MTSSLGTDHLSAPTVSRRSGGATLSQRRATDRWLLSVAIVFAAAELFHGADHLRRGVDSAGRDVFWLGTAGIVLEVGVVVLICQRHRLAPLASAAAGFSLAAGYLAVHFLPARPWFSDSFTSAASTSATSWVAASLEVTAALALGITGTAALHRRGGLESAVTPHLEQRPLRHALVHPLALAMILGNAAILVISLMQL